MLDHVSLGVSDIERSRKFYDEALRPLGIERLYAEGETASGYGAGRKAFFWIGLRDGFANRQPRRLRNRRPRDRGPISPGRHWPLVGATTASRGCVRTITKTTTARSCSIRTATTSKRYAAGSKLGTARFLSLPDLCSALIVTTVGASGWGSCNAISDYRACREDEASYDGLSFVRRFRCADPSFLHGWPELSISWRHQLPVFAELGFVAWRRICVDMADPASMGSTRITPSKTACAT